MASITAGEIWGYAAPTAGNTVEVPIVLTDAAGAKVTGVTFNDAGMAVSYRKEGAHAFSAFPTFDTNNWAECGNGEYVIILRQSDATELALMDTEGTLTFYVVCTATAGDLAKIKVNPADSFRDDAVAALVDSVWDELLTGATHNIATSAGRRLRQLEPGVGGGTIWYVDGVSGSDLNAGDSPDDPFLTIGAALAVVSTGEDIRVFPATYTEAGLDLDVAGIALVCQRGTILTGGGTGTCLVVSAASCLVSGTMFLPGAAEIGVDIESTANHTSLVDLHGNGCSTTFDVNAPMCTIEDCRSYGHTVTGFDVSSAHNHFHECVAEGEGAVRGFYLSTNAADGNALYNCATLGNTTAGFEVVSGASINAFITCASGGADGARVDAGTDNSWAGYATLPIVVPGDEMDLVDAPNSTAVTAIQSGLSTLAAGAEMDLVDAPNATAVTAIQSGLALEGADGDTLETLSDQIDGVGAGGGSYVVTRTIKDVGGNAVASLKTTIQGDSAGAADGNVIATAITTSSGSVTFNLDAGTYHLLTPSTGVWQASDTTLTITGNDTDEIEITAQTLPAPSAADKYVIIVNCADEFGDLVGASTWTLKVTDVEPRGLGTANLVQLTEENPKTSDGDGQIAFEISQETTRLSVEISVLTAASRTWTQRITVNVDGSLANDDDQIYLADLMTSAT
ncbi:MAG TPA: hypothetical protein VM487_15925 [Phycisphaerae bacterium]|nr:hypothetical protein [Phycisphaerae bacterium]